MNELVIIPCGGAKLDKAAPAAELYTGSMFVDTLRTARTMTNDDNIRILSAKYGLLKLNEIVSPYDVKMGDKDSISEDLIAHQLAQFIAGESVRFTKVHCLLPKKYHAAMWAAIRIVDGRTFLVRNYFDGCAGIGYQKAVLKTIREGVAA